MLAKVLAKNDFRIAVLSHFEEPETDLQSLYIDELKALAGREFELEFIERKVDWSLQGIDRELEALYADPNIDMVLVLGFAANQHTIKRQTYGKPTFLPFLIESETIEAPYEEGTSGKKNLNYLAYSTQFLESLEVLQDVVAFKRIAVIADQSLFDSLPAEMIPVFKNGYKGIQLIKVAHDGIDSELISAVPKDVDAVILGLLPRLKSADVDKLISDAIERKMPAFTYLGKGLVQRGILATPINDSSYLAAARRNALNMQAIMLGERASEQPLLVENQTEVNDQSSDGRKDWCSH